MKRRRLLIGLILSFSTLFLLLSIVFAPFFVGLTGEYLISRGEYSKAIDIANIAINLKPDYAYIYNTRAYAYEHTGDLEQALRDYNQAISLKPGEWFFYGRRGDLFRTLDKSEMAIADYTTALEINPDDIDSLVNRGREFALNGKYTEATEDFTEAIAIDPKCADAYLSRGIVWSLSDTEKARSDYEMAAKLFDEQGQIDDANLARQMTDDLDQ